MNLVTRTLPNQYPCQQSVGTVPSAKDQSFRSLLSDQSNTDPLPLQFQTWASTAARFNDNIEYLARELNHPSALMGSPPACHNN